MAFVKKSLYKLNEWFIYSNFLKVKCPNCKNEKLRKFTIQLYNSPSYYIDFYRLKCNVCDSCFDLFGENDLVEIIIKNQFTLHKQTEIIENRIKDVIALEVNQ